MIVTGKATEISVLNILHIFGGRVIELIKRGVIRNVQAFMNSFPQLLEGSNLDWVETHEGIQVFSLASGALDHGTFTMTIAHIPILILGVISIRDLDPYRCTVCSFAASVPATMLHVDGLVDGAVVVDKEMHGDAAIIQHLLARAGTQTHVPVINEVADGAAGPAAVVIMAPRTGFESAVLGPQYHLVPINRNEVAIVYNVVRIGRSVRLVFIDCALAFCPYTAEGSRTDEPIRRKSAYALPFFNGANEFIVLILFPKPCRIPA